MRSILLKTSICGNVAGTDRAQYFVHLVDPFQTLRVARIDDMQQKRGVARLLERGTKRRDQLVRQIADEADGIGEHCNLRTGQFDAPYGRVERREELVGDVRIRASQRVEERRLACVRVSHQGDCRHRHFAPRLAARVALALQSLEASTQRPDAVGEQAPVRFQLRLARAAQADAAFLSLQVRPASDEPRGDVTELRQLDLELAFETARALRKDVEDEAVAIQHAALDKLLEIAFLAR